MSENIDADELLDIQRNKNRANYSDRLVRQAQNEDITQKSVVYSGFNPNSGLHIVTPVGGQPLEVARVITTGAIAIGQPIQLTRSNGALTAFIDDLPQGSRPYAAGGGGAGAGGNQPSSGSGFFSGSGSGNTNEDSEEPCGYKVVNGEVEAQFECSEGDPDLFDNAEDVIASVTGATCANSVFPMTQPIAYASPGDSVIQSVRVIAGSWTDGTRLDQTCPALIINEARTTAGADFDTNYANNSGSCTYRICTKVLENNYGCVTEGGEARCAYFPDGSGSYKTLEECETAISPGFTGGQSENVLYSVSYQYTHGFYGVMSEVGYSTINVMGPVERAGWSLYFPPGDGPDRGSGPEASLGIYHNNTFSIQLGGSGGISTNRSFYTSKINSVVRADGLPDVGGNPKKSCP